MENKHKVAAKEAMVIKNQNKEAVDFKKKKNK